jgi:hypothetical protein
MFCLTITSTCNCSKPLRTETDEDTISCSKTYTSDATPHSTRSTRKRLAKKSGASSARESKRIKPSGTKQPVTVTRKRGVTHDDATLGNDSSDEPARDLFPSNVSLSPATVASRPSPRPDFSGTDKERLTRCLETLRISQEVDAPEFDADGTSHLSVNLKRVENFLTAVIESDGEHGHISSSPDVSSDCISPPAALYVCGVPGIGKSLGIKWCCRKAVATAAERSENHLLEARFIHINAAHLQGLPEFYREIATGLGLKSFKKESIQKKLSHEGKKLKRTLLIVAMDEIDLLISDSPNDVEKVTGTEKVAQVMLSWAADPKVRFALIGISNSSGNAKYARLQQLGKVSDATGDKHLGSHQKSPLTILPSCLVSRNCDLRVLQRGRHYADLESPHR